MKKILFILSTLLLISSAFLFADPATISVNGTGTISIKADTASITLAVITFDQEASVAASKNATIMNKVSQSLLSAGISSEDISTDNYYLRQETRYYDDGKKETKEYRVSNNITVIVKDIDKVGATIDAALSGGANQLSNVSFFASNTSKAYDQARVLAVQQASNSAALLTQTAGRKLGKAIRIEEYSNGSALRNEYVADMVMMKAESTPISSGSTDISVTVQITFEMK